MAGALQSPDLKTGRKEESAEQRALPFTYFLPPSVLHRSLIQNQAKAQSRWELPLLSARSRAASLPSALHRSERRACDSPTPPCPMPGAGDGVEGGCLSCREPAAAPPWACRPRQCHGAPFRWRNLIAPLLPRADAALQQRGP